ncbi:hypothetical protein D3C78_1470960 [compost metagenome]
MRRQVAGTLIAIQAQTLGLLEQERCAQVGAFTAIQPAQGLGRTGANLLGQLRQRQAEVTQVVLDCRKTRQLHQPRQAQVERLVAVKRQQAAVETVLHLQETGITFTVREGPRRHHQCVDVVMVAAAGRFQAFAASWLCERGWGSGHRRVRGRVGNAPMMLAIPGRRQARR